MALDDQESVGGVAGKTVHLPNVQWRWLEARSELNYSRSISAELRRIVAAAMEAEREAVAA